MGMIMSTEGIFASIRTSLTGLMSQSRNLEIIAENIANAEKTADKNGAIYKRKVLNTISEASSFENTLQSQLNLGLKLSNNKHILSASQRLGADSPVISQKLPQIEVKEIDSEKLVYNPTHPMADENGYVRMPDINIIEEMVDMISASRSYEANLTVMNAAKQIAKETMKI
jgi:flagellar basal-body rod protein FlgC